MSLRACTRSAEKSSTHMENLKRLGWFALAGFAASLGAAAAIAMVLVGVDYARKWREPSPLEALAPAEVVTVTDVRIAELTTSGGVRGLVSNRSPSTVHSMRVDIVFSAQTQEYGGFEHRRPSERLAKAHLHGLAARSAVDHQEERVVRARDAGSKAHRVVRVDEHLPQAVGAKRDPEARGSCSEGENPQCCKHDA